MAMGQATSAALGDRVAVEEGTPAADTAVVGVRNQGVTAMVVIAGGRHMHRHMQGRATAVAPDSPRADSLPAAAAVAVGSGFARAADARADLAKRSAALDDRALPRQW